MISLRKNSGSEFPTSPNSELRTVEFGFLSFDMRVALIACHLLVAAAFAPPLTPLPRLAVPRSSRPLGVPMRMADSGKRTWDAASCLRDHRDVLLSLPRIAGAYVGPAAVDPAVSESVMCVVNSVDPCPYCTGLHGELARMAGVEDPAGLQASTGEEIVAKQEPAVVFARSFAEQNGRGARVDKAFAELSAATRPAYALSVQALCWFLLWGKTGGNTINAAIARLRGASPAPNRPP